MTIKMEFTDFEKRVHRLAKKIYARDGRLPVIEKTADAAQWRAWRDWRKQHGLEVGHMDVCENYTVLTDWPSPDLETLERQYASGGKTNL